MAFAAVFDGVARLHGRSASEAEAHHDMPMDFADVALVCVAASR